MPEGYDEAMKNAWILLPLISLFSITSEAEIIRVTDGGVSVNIVELVPNSEPAVLVFHAAWNQDCLTLIEELEQWAVNYPDLKIILVDVVDERSQVYRQFTVEKIPTMLIFDSNQEQVGGAVENVESLELALSNAGFI